MHKDDKNNSQFLLMNVLSQQPHGKLQEQYNSILLIIYYIINTITNETDTKQQKYMSVINYDTL